MSIFLDLLTTKKRKNQNNGWNNNAINEHWLYFVDSIIEIFYTFFVRYLYKRSKWSTYPCHVRYCHVLPLSIVFNVSRFSRVTSENRNEYVKLALHFRLHEFDAAVSAVREGMSRVVPVPLLSLFTGFELETMVCGSPDIPLHLLKSVATYKGKSHHRNHISKYARPSRLVYKQWITFYSDFQIKMIIMLFCNSCVNERLPNVLLTNLFLQISIDPVWLSCLTIRIDSCTLN